MDVIPCTQCLALCTYWDGAGGRGGVRDRLKGPAF